MTAHGSSRERLAELTSGVGAGVLGLGLGALLSTVLGAIAIPLAVAGGLLHACGMFDRMRLQREQTAAAPAWSTALYWLCWGVLGFLAIYLVMIRLT